MKQQSPWRVEGGLFGLKHQSPVVRKQHRRLEQESPEVEQELGPMCFGVSIWGAASWALLSKLPGLSVGGPPNNDIYFFRPVSQRKRNAQKTTTLAQNDTPIESFAQLPFEGFQGDPRTELCFFSATPHPSPRERTWVCRLPIAGKPLSF